MFHNFCSEHRNFCECEYFSLHIIINSIVNLQMNNSSIRKTIESFKYDLVGKLEWKIVLNLTKNGFLLCSADSGLFVFPSILKTFFIALYVGTSFVAVTGNILVIYVIIFKRVRTVTNMYIANLALADVIIGLFAIPFQFQAALLQRWNLPDFMCPFCPFFQVI